MSSRLFIAAALTVALAIFPQELMAQTSVNAAECNRIAAYCHSSYESEGYSDSYSCFQGLASDLPSGGCPAPTPLHIDQNYTTYNYNNVLLCYGVCLE